MIIPIIIALIFSLNGWASSPIQDVSPSDPAYGIMTSTVKKDYFSLVDGKNFLPNQSVTRKELALIVNRLDELIEQSQASDSDMRELRDFSRQFKTYLMTMDSRYTTIQGDINQIQTEQKTLHYDASQLHDTIESLKKSQANQTTFIWLGIGLGVLGIIIR